VASQAIYALTDLDATSIRSRPVELFQGVMFIVAVMLLPHGIVGSWNRWWYVRRLRRQERDAARAAQGGAFRPVSGVCAV